MPLLLSIVVLILVSKYTGGALRSRVGNGAFVCRGSNTNNRFCVALGGSGAFSYCRNSLDDLCIRGMNA